MKKGIVTLTWMTYTCLVVGAISSGVSLYHHWLTGFVDPFVGSWLTVFMLGLCCFVILRCLKLLDGRLTEIEKRTSVN